MTQMRVLFTQQPLMSHFEVHLPLARALISAGHDVAFATSMQIPESFGVRCFAAGTSFSEIQTPGLIEELESMAPRERARRVIADFFAGVFAERMAADLLDLARTWRPDLIIDELFEFGGSIAAERIGVPLVTEQNGVTLPGSDAASPRLNALRMKHGLAPVADAAMRPQSTWIAPAPPELAVPSAHCFRYEALESHATVAVAEFTGSGEEPLVVVTFGTTFGAGQDLLRAINDAVRDLPVRLIITLGPRDVADARHVTFAQNVRLTTYVPHGPLFARAAAVISHGGWATILKALYHGLPMVLVPLGAEQHDNARTASRLGFAIPLEERRDAASIASAIQQVLQADEHRSSAQWLRMSMLAQEPISNGVSLLQALL